jgi:CTP:molybdopterin cytidylyltransferase MocA
VASDASPNNRSSLKPVSDIAGLILAAGASSRMGRPKALLKNSVGASLLSGQVELIRDSGIDRVGVVIGAHADEILETHPELDVVWIENKGWEVGQFSSVQIGLKELVEFTRTGIVILPVDVAGVNPSTIRAIIESALINPHIQVIIPEFEERGGHPIYLSHQFCNDLVGVEPSSEDARLDMQIKKTDQVLRLPARDPAITRNINTPEEWALVRSTLL